MPLVRLIFQALMPVQVVGQARRSLVLISVVIFFIFSYFFHHIPSKILLQNCIDRINIFIMELKEIEPRNLTDKIVESMSEGETDAYVEPKDTYTPETEVGINKSVVPISEAEAELLLEPESINRPILATDGESVHEKNGRSCKKWSLSCLIIGIVIGGTATGLLMHFIFWGELNSQFCIEYSFYVSHSL